MKATSPNQTAVPSLDREGSANAATFDRWVRLLAGVLVILAFAFGALPGLQRLGPVREVREAAQKAGIDASTLLYSESDVYCEAEASIRDALDYSARGAD